MAKLKVKAATTYDAKSLKSLKFPDNIRHRMEMYMGGRGIIALFQMWKEIFDNCVDEAQEGHATRISVWYNSKLREFIMSDNGRGVPTGYNSEEKLYGCELVYATIHGSGKFNSDSYTNSVGLNGVGAACVTALSEYLQVWSHNEGKWKTHSFKRGISTGKTELGSPASDLAKIKKGTIVKWKPDQKLFGDDVIDIVRMSDTCKNMARLNPGLEIVVSIDGKSKTYKSEHGLLDMIYETAEQKESALVKPFQFQKKGVIDIAVVWNDDDAQQTWSYVNSSHTPEEGTHVQGARNALLEALRSEVDAKSKTSKEPSGKRGRGKEKDTTIDAKFLLMGMRLALHCRVSSPSYSGQTKDKLSNPEVVSSVKNLVLPEFSAFIKKNPKLISTLIDRAKKFQKASEKFQLDMKAVKSITLSAPGTRGLLPGKLAQATGKFKPEDIELFLVEGSSAAGPAKEVRLPWQEVLELKGKILNAARADLAQVLGSDEVRDIIMAIGAKPGDECTTHGGNVRIGRITIMTDADSDGKHICSLLIALFSKYFRPWLEELRISYVLLPLFVGAVGDHKEFGFTLDEMLEKFPAAKRKSVTVNRLKGLGECTNTELLTYGMNPETRKIQVLEMNDADVVEIQKVMGDDVAYRKEFLGITALKGSIK